jgi:hypothetical protein
VPRSSLILGFVVVITACPTPAPSDDEAEGSSGSTGSTAGETTSASTSETSSEATSSDTTSESESTSDTTSETESTSETSSETDTGADTPPGPLPGDPCTLAASFSCGGGPTPTDAGVPLLCPVEPPLELEPTELFAGACEGACLNPNATPVNACGNIGEPAACLCESPDAPDCVGAQLGCIGRDELHLCFEGKVVVGTCVAGCGLTPEGWFACDN